MGGAPPKALTAVGNKPKSAPRDAGLDAPPGDVAIKDGDDATVLSFCEELNLRTNSGTCSLN